MEHGQPSPFSPSSPPDLAQSRLQQAADASRCAALLQSPDFQWFLERCIGGEIADAREIALNGGQHPTISHKSARAVHEAMVRVLGWTKERLESAKQFLDGP